VNDEFGLIMYANCGGSFRDTTTKLLGMISVSKPTCSLFQTNDQSETVPGFFGCPVTFQSHSYSTVSPRFVKTRISKFREYKFYNKRNTIRLAQHSKVSSLIRNLPNKSEHMLTKKQGLNVTQSVSETKGSS
jgi:hypothetical protein